MAIDANKKEVYIRVVFLRLDNVDTLKEQFDGDIYYRVRWREPKLDTVKDKSSTDFSKLWNPNITILNQISEKLKKVWFETQDRNGETYVLQKVRLKGTFTERLELHDFPFDSQELNISFTSQLPESELDILEDQQKPSEIGVSCYIHAQEWDLQHYVEAETAVTSTEIGLSPVLKVRGLAVRKYTFFLWNIIIIMTLIGSLPITTFAINRNNPQRRLLLGFILALTGVSFRFMANQTIPKIPYQTLLDRYLLVSMMFNYVVCIWHIVVSRYDDIPNTQRTMDFWAFVIVVALYFAYQLTFLLIVVIKTLLLNRMIDNKVKNYNVALIKLGKKQRVESSKKIQKKQHSVLRLSYTTEAFSSNLKEKVE